MTALVTWAPRIIILGGGFNGRLVQHAVPGSRVFDWRQAKPEKEMRSYGPQYLWEPIIGLENRKFLVTTLVDGRPATELKVLHYKHKVGKQLDGGDWRAQFQTSMPGYEVTLPPDTVEYRRRLLWINVRRQEIELSDGTIVPYDYLLSTIPLFSLLAMLKMHIHQPVIRSLKYKPIYFSTHAMSRLQRLHPSSWSGGMRVNYLSDPAVPWYRETHRAGEVFRESLVPFVSAVTISPGKIYPSAHVPAMLEELRSYRIWTFGRFANWATDELAHETFGSAQRWALEQKLTEGVNDVARAR